MDAPCMKVKCGVTNCAYNEGHMCYANALEVNPMDGAKASISDETCCTTFKEKTWYRITKNRIISLLLIILFFRRDKIY